MHSPLQLLLITTLDHGHCFLLLCCPAHHSVIGSTPVLPHHLLAASSHSNLTLSRSDVIWTGRYRGKGQQREHVMGFGSLVFYSDSLAI